MISEKILNALERQINFEFESAYLYLGMSRRWTKQTLPASATGCSSNIRKNSITPIR